MKIKRYVRTILVCLFICLYVITDVALASNSQQSADVGTPKDSVVNKELGRYQEQPISLYTQVHLDFIGGQKYKDRMNNTWGEIIYDGLTGFGSDAAEALYDMLDTPSDLLNFQKPSVFENPYDEIMMILIRSEAGFSENTINLEYDRTLYDCVCDINDVCDAIDPEWQMEDADFYEQFTELLNYADTVEDQNPEFYKKVLQLFSGNEEVIKDALNTFGNVSFFFDRVSDTVTVLNAVFDTVKYNATVKAYINCSNMFKEYLSDIEKTMEKEAGKNASKKRYSPQIKQYDTYASQFKSAKEKYDRFLTDDVIADEILKEYMKEQVIDTTVLLAGLTDDFCENIALNFVTKALDLSKKTAQYVFAAVEAYKTGWAISEFLTGNETNMECRELARAYYYLENACVLIVKEYQGWLELNKQEEAAFKFDTAYRSLQTIECATLANYKEYLQAQDESLLRRVINFFTKHSNDDEIKICEQYASEWEDEKCHVSGKDFTSIAGQIVDKNDIPVEGLLVTISTDKTKNVVFSGRTDADGHFFGEIKKGSEGLSIRVSDDNGMLLEKMLLGMVKYGHNELGVIKLNYFESAMTIGIESDGYSGEEGVIEEYKAFLRSQSDARAYLIYDIDKDGYPEIFIEKYIEGDRAFVFDIYTFRDEEFRMLDTKYGPGGHGAPIFASFPEGNGVFEYIAFKGKELIQLLTWPDGKRKEETMYVEDASGKYYQDTRDQVYSDSYFNKVYINHQFYQSETSSPYCEGSLLLAHSSLDNFTAVYEAFGEEKLPESKNTGGYDSLLALYAKANAENWDRDKLSKEGLNYQIPDLGEVGYYIEDINNDQTPELMIGAINPPYEDFVNSIIDMYTLDNGHPKKIFKGTERVLGYLSDNGILMVISFGGAEVTSYEYDYLDPDNLEFYTTQSVYYDGFYNSANPWYSDSTHTIAYSEEEARDIMARYPKRDMAYNVLNK